MFVKTAKMLMLNWAKNNQKKASLESFNRLTTINKNSEFLDNPFELRRTLLDFIADFANWDNSTDVDYLETSRTLTQTAHEALGGEVGTRPLVVDPFAGGGSIPLEALRVGADAFASDLNPVAVLLNKVVLEYVPKYGQRLADEARKWGQWVKEEAEKELAEFYPKDEDGSTPIAYLWARTIISEAPDDGSGIPVEIPLMRSLWLAKKAGRNKALRWVRDDRDVVQTETVEVTYAGGVKRKLRRPLLEIFEPKSEKEVGKGTVARGSATCPVTGYTTPVVSVRKQLKERNGGASDPRLICIIFKKFNANEVYYSSNIEIGVASANLARTKLLVMEQNHVGKFSLLPYEKIPLMSGVFNVPIYGHETWSSLFTYRQLLAISTYSTIIRKIPLKKGEEEFYSAIKCLLALTASKMTSFSSSLCVWRNVRTCVAQTFGRQALPMVWDFGEMNPFAGSAGDFTEGIEFLVKFLDHTSLSIQNSGISEISSAVSSPMPTDGVDFFITDPPYYNAVPYADLSDFFYVWIRRMLFDTHNSLFANQITPKDEEICEMAGWDSVRYPHKDGKWFENKMFLAMSEGVRVLKHTGIGVIVFAHKSTSGWESQLQAMIDAGWIITGSWTIDTERSGRLRAHESAALASSVHLVCRTRENPDGTLREEIGDWRDVLQELPQRIKEWMPRLTEQGVVGADAIFACLGPALEIFSRYSSVEKASGEIVPLREYLEYVWAAISKEALSTIFKDADTSSFEEDARLTAMWLWTLSAGDTETDKTPLADEEDVSDDDDESTGKKAKVTGFSLEYDAARKIAQGLGAHLETLTHLVEVKGGKARLLPVKERAAYLFGKEGIATDIPKKKSQGNKQLTITGILDELPEDEYGEIKITRIGETVCDKVHQAMLLFNSGRSEALKRFLLNEAIGKDAKFWQLAQSFSALYPAGTDEKRWVDGLLSRKKGLGL
ncbi:hypothetical protein NDA04_21835 [Trichocoleus sp. AS-A2]